MSKQCTKSNESTKRYSLCRAYSRNQSKTEEVLLAVEPHSRRLREIKRFVTAVSHLINQCRWTADMHSNPLTAQGGGGRG